MDDHDAVGVLGPEGLDVGRPEPLVDGAVALPQQQGGALQGGLVEATCAETGSQTAMSASV